MKNIKPFNKFLKENLEIPGEAPNINGQPQTRVGETETIELKTQLDKLNSKLSEGQFFLVEEDLGGEYAGRGIYNDLNIFVQELKNFISKKEDISQTEIEIEIDELSDADYILVSYDGYEDMFRYTIVTPNEYYNNDL
jgi:hypothetical protein